MQQCRELTLSQNLIHELLCLSPTLPPASEAAACSPLRAAARCSSQKRKYAVRALPAGCALHPRAMSSAGASCCTAVLDGSAIAVRFSAPNQEQVNAQCYYAVVCHVRCLKRWFRIWVLGCDMPSFNEGESTSYSRVKNQMLRTLFALARSAG
jgi:hypothetical protein